MIRALENESKKMPYQPPAIAPRSLQYDLFTSFFGENADFSNTVELWDSLPIYSLNYRQQAALRNKQGHFSKPVIIDYKYQPTPSRDYTPVKCQLTIQPTKIETEKGWIDFIPGPDEHLIEEVLKKIFCDQQYGLHDVKERKSFVNFTLYMIEKELKARGKSRRRKQIKQSLDILSGCVVRVEFIGRDKSKAVYKGAILNDFVAITKDDYLDDPAAKWRARFPEILSEAINGLSYRQFNYATLMSLKFPLSRWLHKKLCHYYTNAALTVPYTILLSSIERDSHMLCYSRRTKSVEALDKALDELVAKNIILMYDKHESRDKIKILDIKYILTPASQFTQEVIAANGRHKLNADKMHGAGNKGDWLKLLDRKSEFGRQIGLDTANEKARENSIKKSEKLDDF